MALLTGAALLVGIVIVAIAVLSQNQPRLSDRLVQPAFDVPAGLADGRTLGKADAPVTLQIWSDFQCPACQVFSTQTEPSVVTTFVIPGTLKIEYRDAAFQGRKVSSSYDESVESAAAARCAGDQGKFWQYHDWLFANWGGENQGAFRADRLRAIAERVGLDRAAYDACMTDGSKQSAVKAETDQTQQLGIDSTPTLYVNGVRNTGALGYDQLAQLIRAAAANPSPAASPSP